ncbi:hypothetical protein COT63_02095 [Candidatus Shapirobacteria bacterium CG09_land_8_20_14_0_10_38_17]|uniref:LysM domain-containing protein n=1 Tax=Candidatus Shapirobacteria bacterium CG09_land_8_20_14_0_10_38_17 TaxID=1974884 RepID=A0A2H0WQW1_9BACT|nr:MAG: hypothetical protein COT63_02095 [Candidatus Shapirobacteria bacterium CG09_land_8_20_14_0_10_38_17]
MFEPIKSFFDDFSAYLRAWYLFLKKRFFILAGVLENVKSEGAHFLYRQRGRFARPISHFSVGILVVLVIALSPLVSWEKIEFGGNESQILGTIDASFTALGSAGQSSSNLQGRGGIAEYQVVGGDTVSSIAQKFGVSLDTIRWANNLKSVDDIKPDQVLRVLPISGVLHSVRRGETVYSIAKIYSVDPQAIVDFPFNTFIDDETFALAVGQELVVPSGVMPKVKLWSKPAPKTDYLAEAPVSISDQGQTQPTDQFIWPTVGKISQGYFWYHKAIDIANSAAPAVVASRGGIVLSAGWNAPQAYGIHIIVDHGDGYKTLYAHLSSVAVSPGQSVLRGQVIGQMGSTGRSTGIHLHFEIRAPKGNVNPLSYLQQ